MSEVSPTLSVLLSEMKRALRPEQPSLSEVKEASILALYFSSAWCDDSQASHEHVTEVFKTQQLQEDGSPDVLIDLIYVSSDTSAEELQGNLEDGWKFIPFEQEELRSNIKRHFGICAKKEMEALGITLEERKGGIPTLILIESKSCKVLTTDAISQVIGESRLENPLSFWKSLLLATAE